MNKSDENFRRIFSVRTGSFSSSRNSLFNERFPPMFENPELALSVEYLILSAAAT